MRTGFALVAALGLFAGSATAAEEGFYVGAGVGDFNTEVALSDYFWEVKDFDEGDFGFKIFGGYNFLPWLGVEGIYTDGGSPKAKIYEDVDGKLEAEFSVSALTAAAVFTLPLGEQFELFIKPGFAYWKVDGKVTATSSFDRESSSGDDSDYAFFIGGGVGFNLNEQLGFRAEYEAFEPGENFDFEEGEYNQDIATRFFSASVLFRF